jgi:hypothetical protein
MSPLLSSPENDIKTSESSIILQWAKSTGATGYHVQVSRTSTFSEVIIDEVGVHGTSLMITLPENELVFWRVSAINDVGGGTWSPWRTIRSLNSVADVNDQYQLIGVNATPNPVGSLVKIQYTVPAPGHVSTTLLDINGNEVLKFVDAYLSVGTYEVPFRTESLVNGVYLYNVTYNNVIHRGKIVVNR